MHGTSLETMCVAMIVPDVESLRATMMTNGVQNLPDSDEELLEMKVRVYGGSRPKQQHNLLLCTEHIILDRAWVCNVFTLTAMHA